MKKLLFVAIICSAGVLSSAQDTTQFPQLRKMLSSYYNLKNALVTESSASASVSASDFIRYTNTIDYKLISEGNINLLIRDATIISETNDIAKQRRHFANLSANMASVVELFKFSNEPVYIQYCPMKKASWLSNEEVIRNPYYGSAMLTCGTVKKTIINHNTNATHH